MLGPPDIPIIIIADVHRGIPMPCSLSPGMPNEATQKGHEVDSTIIPILQMEKLGVREELTSPKLGSLEVTKSGLESRLSAAKVYIISYYCSRTVVPNLLWPCPT